MESTWRDNVKHLAAGAGAGLTADSIVHPIDTVRTRMQVERGVSQKAYRGLFHAFSTIFRTEGIAGFYKGFPAVALSTVPAHALYFTGYEMAKEAWIRTTGTDTALGHFLAGAWADVCGAVVWVPQDVVKQRLQIQRSRADAKYRGTLDAVRVILAEEGVRGLYRGYAAALATYAPFVGIYFALYEQSKHVHGRWLGTDPEKLPLAVHMIGGAEAGAVAAAVTCPMDVIKTRMQVQHSRAEQRYAGIGDAIRTILREEGPRAFTKGMVARIWWIAPSTAITISAYEQFKRLLQPL